MWVETLYTAISRKAVQKNVHATIQEDNMEYDQNTVVPIQ